MKTRVIEWIKCVLLVICCLFILSGAVNNGITRWLYGIPFVFLAIWLTHDWPGKIRAPLAIIMVLLSWLIWPSEDNRLIYPYVGESLYLEGDFVSVRYSGESHYYIHKLNELPPADLLESQTGFGDKSDETLRTLLLSGVNTSHPDFSLKLYAILVDENGNHHFLSEDMLKEGINNGTISTSEHSPLNTMESLQTRWSYWLGMGMAWPALVIMLLQFNWF